MGREIIETIGDKRNLRLYFMQQKIKIMAMACEGVYVGWF